MFILIEDRAEIRRAQSQLEATLRREFSIKEVRDIGWQGDRLRAAKLHSNGEYWYWSQDHKTTPNPRRLNWFGRINEGPGVGIAVEINIPYEGRNDSVAGFFAKHASSGQIYLFHSGRVGGGAKGQEGRIRGLVGSSNSSGICPRWVAEGRSARHAYRCAWRRPCSRSLRGGHHRFQGCRPGGQDGDHDRQGKGTPVSRVL